MVVGVAGSHGGSGLVAGGWAGGCRVPDGRFVAAHGGWWLEAEQLVAGGGWLVVGGRWLVAGGWWLMASRWWQQGKRRRRTGEEIIQPLTVVREQHSSTQKQQNRNSTQHRIIV